MDMEPNMLTNNNKIKLSDNIKELGHEYFISNFNKVVT